MTVHMTLSLFLLPKHSFPLVRWTLKRESLYDFHDS